MPVILYRTTFAMLTMVALLFCYQPNNKAVPLVHSLQERDTMLQFVINNKPTLANLIAKSGLAPILSGNGAYTFLIPSEESLKELENEPAQRIRTILSGHILKGKFLESDLKDGASVETLAGTKVIVCRKKDYTLVDGVRIVSANQEVKNGLIHNLGGIIKI